MVELNKIVIGVLLLSAVVVGFNLMLVDMAGDYGETLDNTTWSNTYNIIEDSQDLLGDQAEIGTEQDPDATSDNPFFKIGAAIRMVWRSMTMMGNMIDNFFTDIIGAPFYLGMVLNGVIGFIIIFAIITALRKFRS